MYFTARLQPEKQLLRRATAVKVFKLWLPKYEQAAHSYFGIHTLAFILRQLLFEQACCQMLKILHSPLL